MSEFYNVWEGRRAKKQSVFLLIAGANTYKLLRNLLTPVKPGDKLYKELVEVLATHYTPTPAESIQRYKFHSWVNKPGESVATFVSECFAPLQSFATSVGH